VEWAARVAGILPPKRINVRIEVIGKTERQITTEESAIDL
jgi:tRNA A37 threonylcarbamoyladenosine biosynthesis protein TsaE